MKVFCMLLIIPVLTLATESIERHRKTKASKATKAVSCLLTIYVMFYFQRPIVLSFDGSPFLLQICHHTGNRKCPWKDMQVADNAVNGHLTHGDKIGSCDTTCMECEEFDLETCQCVFVSCPPSEPPSYFPSTEPSRIPSPTPSTSFGPTFIWVKAGKVPTLAPQEISTEMSARMST